ncbi:carbohydrate esterase family 1 protein [Amniculicola lignicola CBS 123094]|uniref:Carboxylic ester hydrolase n=1 Tax=Amniculicola lignicola CBS 123094 TaxID=1392246 RepID=A0A6A5VXJ1_9PLEO|nr:carbohydrate esterase family 1 protein [Amniculicola lignicola CBS 123094]
MLLSIFVSFFFAATIYAQNDGIFTQIVGWTKPKDLPNPRNVGYYVYIPQNVAPHPPILVVLHWCHGDADHAFMYRSTYAAAADQHKFIIIYPDSPNTADKCWDVSSKESLTHNGGGDAQGIVSMVQEALDYWKGDQDRVFVTGTSSGAMMTNVLLGSYPDVFAAGSAEAGVPFGCFAGDGFDVWNSDCAEGKIVKNGTKWAEIVKNAFPGYTGYRPKLQTFHGLQDNVINPQNLEEQVKQWTSVLGVGTTPTEVTNDTPLKGWTRSRYGSKFEAYAAQGVTHDIPTHADVVLDWFDLKCNSTATACWSRKSG